MGPPGQAIGPPRSDARVGAGILRSFLVSGFLEIPKIQICLSRNTKNPREPKKELAKNTKNSCGSSKVRSYGQMVDTFHFIPQIAFQL